MPLPWSRLNAVCQIHTQPCQIHTLLLHLAAAVPPQLQPDGQMRYCQLGSHEDEDQWLPKLCLFSALEANLKKHIHF